MCWLELLRERESLAAQIDALRQPLPPWTPIPEKRDLLLAQERAGQIDKQPGFVRMQVLRPDSPDTPYLVQMTWIDQQAFEAWVGSDDFKLAP